MCSVGWVLLPLLLLLHAVVYLWASGDTGGEHVHPQVGAGEGRQWRGARHCFPRTHRLPHPY